ncbi:hypothetical protein Tco_0998458 [Tanacetum coccineum]
MLSNQKPFRDKLGLGFNSLEASTSGTKEIKFVKSQKEASPDGGPLNKGGPHIAEATPKAIMGPPVCSPGFEKSVSFQKSILGPRPQHIMVNKVKVSVASDHEINRFYKLSLKPGVGFSKPNFRSKTPPPRRVNNNCPRLKTLLPKKNVGRQNQPHGFLICLGVDLEPDEWIKDSGCSKHMTGNRKLFSSYKAYNGGNVIFGSNLRGNIIGKACKELVRNLHKLKFDQHFCDACKIRKQAHTSHKAKNIVSTTRCLELLHMDLFGPSAVRSDGGNRYTLVIVDVYSRRGTIDKALFIKNDKDDILLVQGYKLQQKKDGIFISQDKYVADILKKFDFATVKTASTPMEPNKALIKDEEADSMDVDLYRSMIGSLMYLTAYRPDIMFAVYACARFQVTPKMSHLHAVKRIFRYLKGQPKLVLWYPRDSPLDLEAFSDSDYARASLDKKSTTGGCQFLGKRLISWQCKKHTIVANSTTEAEYVAAANFCRQSSGPINHVADETVYKEWEDRIERAAIIDYCS